MSNSPQQQNALQTTETFSSDEFSALLNKEFRPKTDQAKEAVENAVKTLAQQALENTVTVSSDAYRTIQALIAEIDEKLSQQINQIIHHDDFQKLEGAWHGLHYLVNNSETDEMLKIRFMSISKQELGRTLKRYKGVGWDQSPIFKKVYEEEYGQFGGEPFGCLVGDYYFDHSPQDVELLGEMAKIGAASHCPFIAGTAPSVMQMESWQELSNPRDLTKIFQNTEYAAWRSLRESEDARYLGLVMPRFLARLPYGIRTNPVDEFDFEEETDGATHGNYTWTNAAYAMAANINRSFKEFGWCTAIRGVESGGAVEKPAVPHLPERRRRRGHEVPDRDRHQRSPRSRAGQKWLYAAGAPQNSDFAAFIGAQSLQKPAEYYDADASANAQLFRAPAVPVRLLPLRALPEVHRARQNWLLPRARRHGTLAERLDHELRGRRSGQLLAGNQVAQTAGRGGSAGGRDRRQPGLLQRQVLPAPALPAGRPDRLPAPGVEAAFAEAKRRVLMD
jgi:type VI secretion system protein ImpC